MKSKKEEVAIVISLTGSNPNILRIAEYMKKMAFSLSELLEVNIMKLLIFVMRF